MDARRNSLCPCGSGRKYKKCCGPKAEELRGREQANQRLFAGALRDYQAGRLQQTEQLCETVLAADPSHAEALHLSGIVAFLTGRHERAVQLIRKAMSFDPSRALYHNSLGASLQELDHWDESAAEYRAAIELNPDYVDALSNLGGALHHFGKFTEALGCLEKAVELNGSHAKAQMTLGLTLHALGRGEAGVWHVRRAVDLAPDSVEITKRYAHLLLELKHLDDALPYFVRLTKLEPDSASAWEELGICYHRQGFHQEAGVCYRRALELEPESMQAVNNLGTYLADSGARREALSQFRKAIDLKPDSTIAWCNAGQMMKDLGLAETALRCFQRALRLEPEHPVTLWNRSVCLLGLGRLAEGWADYEWGWKTGTRTPLRPFSQTRWAGEELTGKTILVWMEQGLGDHILWSSMLPDLMRAGAHCIVECEERLVTLLARSFPTAEVIHCTNPPHIRTGQPDIHFQIPGGSLPQWLRPDLTSFPAHSGFLVPDPERVAHWRERVEALGDGLKVGICWRSMLHGGNRSIFYSQLKQWGGILTTPGVHFVNLQYDECTQELDEVERLFGARVHGWDDIDLKKDQESVAALISALDLVISAATAVDQMAGGLGVPAWVLSRYVSGFWDLGTDHCPWYPSARAFYCGAKDPWEPVLEKIAAELGPLAAAKAGRFEAGPLTHFTKPDSNPQACL